VAGFPPRRPDFEPRSGHVGFVVVKVALVQVSYDYFGFPCKFSFHRLLHIHHHLSSGAGTIVQLVADVPSGLSLTSTQETVKLTPAQSYFFDIDFNLIRLFLPRSPKWTLSFMYEDSL
jgi:hypothetical protein